MYQETHPHQECSSGLTQAKNNISFTKKYRSELTVMAAQLLRFFMQKNQTYTPEECAEALACDSKKIKNLKFHTVFEKNNRRFINFSSLRAALIDEQKDQLEALANHIESLPKYKKPSFVTENVLLPIPGMQNQSSSNINCRAIYSPKDWTVSCDLSKPANTGIKNTAPIIDLTSPDLPEKYQEERANSYSQEMDLFLKIAPYELIENNEEWNGNLKKRTQDKKSSHEEPPAKRKKINEQRSEASQIENSFFQRSNPRLGFFSELISTSCKTISSPETWTSFCK